MNAPDLQQLPAFLQPAQQLPTQEEIDRAKLEARRANYALQQTNFEIAFEFLLEATANGQPLDQFLREFNIDLPAAAFRAWIYKDQRRKNAYMVAKAIGAEAIEDELIRISDGIKADGSASLDDVQRSALRIKTRQWLLEKWNRKRYGDVKQVNTTTTATVDVASMSTEEINRRIMEAMGVQLDPNAHDSTIFDAAQDLDEFA